MHQSLEVQLAKFANERRGTPFQWGVCDCNTLALEALDLISGTDLAKEVIGQYTNGEEAVLFYETFRLDWLAWDGFEEVGLNFAQTGDFLIADDGLWCTPFILVGPNVISCSEDRGVFACRVDVAKRIYPDMRCFRPTHRAVS